MDTSMRGRLLRCVVGADGDGVRDEATRTRCRWALTAAHHPLSSLRTTPHHPYRSAPYLAISLTSYEGLRLLHAHLDKTRPLDRLLDRFSSAQPRAAA